MTIQQAFDFYLPQLNAISSTPQLDLEVLLSFILGRSKTFLYTHSEAPLSEPEQARLRAVVERRLRQEPVAYIIQEKEFYGRSLRVDSATLIPRPATETLVTEGLQLLQRYPHSLIADIGTGTGNIIISLTLEHKPSHWHLATDLSQPALQIARYNARAWGINREIRFFLGDLIQPIYHLFLNTPELLLLANLPYLPTGWKKKVEPGVHYEPTEALWSGSDGLEHYRRLLRQLSILQLPPVFYLLIEILTEQKQLLVEELTLSLPQFTCHFVETPEKTVAIGLISRSQ